MNEDQEKLKKAADLLKSASDMLQAQPVDMKSRIMPSIFFTSNGTEATNALDQKTDSAHYCPTRYFENPSNLHPSETYPS